MPKKLFLIIFAVSLLLLMISSSLDGVRSIALSLTTPAQPISQTITKFKKFVSSISEIRDLRKRVAELETENINLKSKISTQTEILHEATIIKKEFNLIDKDREFEVASVVGRSSSKSLDEIIIDKGTSNDIHVSDIIISNGFLAGVVIKTNNTKSVARLITSAQSLIPIILQDSRAQGLLRGGLDGITAGDIAADIELNPNEAVLTSSLAELIPADIPVGYTSSALSSDSEILRTILVNSPVKFNSLEYVTVVKNNKESVQ